MRVGLIDSPFRETTPSIQLGALKGHLVSRMTVDVDCYHFYMLLDYLCPDRGLQEVFTNGFVGEGLMASLFNEEEAEAILADVARYSTRRRDGVAFRERELHELRAALAALVRECLAPVDWSRYAVIGFSLSYRQLFGSLFIAREIKRHYPAVTVVFGGFLCSGQMGVDLIETFDFIDYIVQGEGEEALEAIVREISGGTKSGLTPIPGVLSRAGCVDPRKCSEGGFISDLDELAYPWFDDFYDSYPTSNRVVLVEGSRGCLWSSKRRGCAFCNNTIGSGSFRRKSTPRLVEEIKALKNRYGADSLIFTDNMFNCRNIETFVAAMKAEHVAFKQVFMELRVPVTYGELALLKQIGLTEVQIGIESLSAGILKKMNKGTRVIDNIAAMKFCEQLGITNNSNIITFYPDVDVKDIEELARAIGLVFPYAPLKSSPYVCSYGSPLYHDVIAAGRRVRRGNGFKYFPPQYRVTVNDNYIEVGNREAWNQIELLLFKWKVAYERLKSKVKYILEYTTTTGGIVVRDHYRDYEFVIDGIEAKIYDYCYETKYIRTIHSAFPDVNDLQTILKRFVRQGIMYEEGNCYLALALRSQEVAGGES